MSQEKTRTCSTTNTHTHSGGNSLKKRETEHEWKITYNCNTKVYVTLHKVYVLLIQTLRGPVFIHNNGELFYLQFIPNNKKQVNLKRTMGLCVNRGPKVSISLQADRQIF